MNSYNTDIMKILWIVIFVVITTVFIQADLFAADNIYRPHKTDQKSDRRQDLYKDRDSSSNLYKPPKSRDREEDSYKDKKDTSDLYKDRGDTSNIHQSDEKQEEQDRQIDIYKP